MQDMVNIAGGEKNNELYQEYLEFYRKKFPNHAPILANISVFLSDASLVAKSLQNLEQEVKFLWDLENSNRNGLQPLDLRKPKQYCSFMDLLWPCPEEELTTNKTNNLLSKVLLYKEQKHGINLHETQTQRPVPSFIGFISEHEADEVLERNELWSEENKISPLFFHGKETHRLQFNLIISAVEQGILDIGELTIIELKTIFAKIKNSETNLPAWDLMIDTVAVGNNAKMRKDHPLLKRHIPTSITNAAEHNSPYIYVMDPFFFHSYLMTVASTNYPYLAQCIIEKFCKSAFKLNKIENSLGYENTSDGYPNLEELPQSKRSVMHTLERQASTYNKAAKHIVNSEHILQYQQAKEKQEQGCDVNNPIKLPLRNGEAKSNGYVFRDTVGIVFYKKPYSGWQEYKKQREQQPDNLSIERKSI
ncbi:LirA/MavJ family T4SS effector [Legionella sainthelensi]|uniref:LirA/MavJ family T4SS effector n=1 Tax=Legionella sainthelensi TaxID=28087 RepID=UPI000E1FC37B|nr:LirA/MavJ family T4SS effector [Legionella sainthelensi]